MRNCQCFRWGFCENDMASKEVKKVNTERAEMKIRRNHQILGMLKAGVSTRAILKEFNMSYSGAKKLCRKIKSSGDCSRVPG